VAYTDRQKELIRVRLKSYYDLQSVGPRKLTWGGICDEIFDLCQVQIRQETLRQFAERFSRRDRAHQPRIPNESNLETIIRFLCHEDINMLSLRELEEPEIPYQLASLLREHLRPESPIVNDSAPSDLNGLYRSIDRYSEETERVIELRLEINPNHNVIRLLERTTFYDNDVKSLKAAHRSITHTVESEGWAVMTADENIFVFMKDKKFKRFFYYLTMGMNRRAWSSTPLEVLLLLRHQYPVQRSQLPKSFEELKEESDGDTSLLEFFKTADLQLMA
jgi:hypothetical protein